MSDIYKPYRVGTYPITAEVSETDKSALDSALATLAANGWTTVHVKGTRRNTVADYLALERETPADVA